MRTAILCICVLGLAAMVGGQPSSSSQLKRIVYGPSTAITADSLQHDPTTNTVHARGQVEIKAAPSTFTADEADIHIVKSTRTAVDLDIALRGNVRVVVTPSESR